MIYYRRRTPELWEEIAAAAAGAATGLAVYYVARALLGRHPIPGPEKRPDAGDRAAAGPEPDGAGAERAPTAADPDRDSAPGASR